MKNLCLSLLHHFKHPSQGRLIYKEEGRD